MSGKTFFDTNVLVYAFDDYAPDKQAKARELLRGYGSSGELVLSTQVLQEFYVVVTAKLKKSISLKVAEEIVCDLASFPLVQINKGLIIRAMQRHQQQMLSFWDSLIIEAALHAQCNILLTEDMQDGFQVESLTIQNPF